MAKRTRVCKGKGRGKKCYYVERDKFGRFKRWSGIKRSITADTRRRSKTRPKRKGYGHRGDY